MIINLALLGFFKYYDFLAGTVNSLIGTTLPLTGVALPIGISFYTFQTMSYTIDVYRGDAEPQKNIISFGAYVALFPQLIAGPIVAYKTVADQLNNRVEDTDKFAYGIKRFTAGLGKKVLLANSAGVIWDTIKVMDMSLPPRPHGLDRHTRLHFPDLLRFLRLLGHGDRARKHARLQVPRKLRLPLYVKKHHRILAADGTSLGSWFRDYVYIPLGGNRKGFAKQIRNICVVWLADRLWHGANWTFVLWGAYFGVLLIIEKMFLLKALKKAPAIVGHIYTMFFVIISWVIFALDDMKSVTGYIGAMFGAGGALYDRTSLYLLSTNIILLVILALASTDIPAKLGNSLVDRLGEKPFSAVVQNVVFAAVLLISTAYLVDATYNPFLYFRF